MITDVVHIDEETIKNIAWPIKHEQSLYQIGPQKLVSGAGRYLEICVH